MPKMRVCFDGANPVDGALAPRNAREPGRSHAYDLSQVSQILKVLPLLVSKKSGCDCGVRGAASGRTARSRVERLRRNKLDRQSFNLAISGKPPENARQPRFGAGHSAIGDNFRRISQIHGQSTSRCDFS